MAPGSSVTNLREAILSITSIPVEDQILLVDGKRLNQQSWELYGPSIRDKEIFLFDRRVIRDPNFPLPENAMLVPIDTLVPQIRPLSKEFESKPLIHALKTYEFRFQSQFLIAQAIRDAVDRRLFVCKTCFNEMHIQLRGIDFALGNLDDHIRQLAHTHGDFIALAKRQSVQNDELLENFDYDIQQLKEVHLHPSHNAPGMTLFDFVPEARLRKWAEEGRADNEKLKDRIPEMENDVRQLQQEADLEKRRPLEVEFRDLNDRLVRGDSIMAEISTKLQMFSKDYENVRNRLDEALRSMHQNVGSFCDGFDEIYKVHEAHLTQLQQFDEISRQDFDVFAKSKIKLTMSIYMRLRAVSAQQTKAREVYHMITLMTEAINKIKSSFAQLAIVKNMPHAYRAAVQEVTRRRGFSKKVRREVLRMNEVLAKLRSEEVPIRDEFMNTFYPYIPKDVFPGLLDPLPPLEISLPPFDSHLPAIDSCSYEDDDFTLVPFSDEPIPKPQAFDRENTFSQSGSRDIPLTPDRKSVV